MTIYEIRWHTGERSWVCANTIIEAIQVYCKRRNTEFSEFDGMDDIYILPKLKWFLYKIKNSKTFNNYMRTAIIPDVIAESFMNDMAIVKPIENKVELNILSNNKIPPAIINAK